MVSDNYSIYNSKITMIQELFFNTAVASNRPTEALVWVISFTFVVYSHYKHS